MTRAKASQSSPGALRAWCALGFALALCAPACRRGPPPQKPPPPAAAAVNGEPIPLSRVQLEVDRLRHGSGAADGGDTESGPAQVDAKDVPRLARAVLESLVERALVLGRARAAGLRVSDAEVQRAVDALAESTARGGESFEQRLARDGQTPEGLFEETRDQLLAERWVAQQTGAEPVTPAEARAWYEAHKARYEAPEAVHCAQIAVRSPDEAKSLLDQLRKGAVFEELARTHSISPDSRTGGDLGWFPRGTMPKAFDEACFSLQPGKLSGVVQSPYGFHVFRAIAKRPARHRTFDEVKAEAQRRASLDKRTEAQRQLLAQLRAGAQVRVDEAVLAQVR